MKGREGSGCFYKEKVYYYKFAIYSKQKRRTNGDLRLHLMKPASRQLKLDVEINAASKKGKRKIALKKRQKGIRDLIWVDFLVGHNIKCGMERVRIKY